MGNKRVFINGCFDILHPGHIKMFQYAKQHGDYLMVAIDTDERVKASKGSDRPFNSVEDRMYVLSSIKFVDEVRKFGTDQDLIDLIKNYKPDIMIVGSDYKDKIVIGSMHAKELKFFSRINEYSTTKTIQSLVDR